MDPHNTNTEPTLRNGIRLEAYRSPTKSAEDELAILQAIKENPETCFSAYIIQFYEQNSHLEKQKTT